MSLITEIIGQDPDFNRIFFTNLDLKRFISHNIISADEISISEAQALLKNFSVNNDYEEKIQSALTETLSAIINIPFTLGGARTFFGLISSIEKPGEKLITTLVELIKKTYQDIKTNRNKKYQLLSQFSFDWSLALEKSIINKEFLENPYRNKSSKVK